MKNKPKTLKEFIVAYLAKHGPTRASVLRRKMYEWKHNGSLAGFTSHYVSYFATMTESSDGSNNRQARYNLWCHIGKRNARGEFRPAILTLTPKGKALAQILSL